jgi:hypothetical protein
VTGLPGLPIDALVGGDDRQIGSNVQDDSRPAVFPKPLCHVSPQDLAAEVRTRQADRDIGIPLVEREVLQAGKAHIPALTDLWIVSGVVD